MRIANLVEHPEALPLVAQWLYEQWEYLVPHSSVETVIKNLEETLQCPRLPVTLIALSRGKIVGTASLIEHDLDERPEFSPWLANVYVLPEERQKGIGTALINAIIEQAKRSGFNSLYLFTHNQEAFYQHFGWKRIEMTKWHTQPVVIMKMEIQSR